MTQAPARDDVAAPDAASATRPRPVSTPGSRASRRPWPRATSPAAAALFATDSYWRDLVAFTWNITTVEGRAGVTDLLEHTWSPPEPPGSPRRSRPTRPTAC